MWILLMSVMIFVSMKLIVKRLRFGLDIRVRSVSIVDIMVRMRMMIFRCFLVVFFSCFWWCFCFFLVLFIVILLICWCILIICIKDFCLFCNFVSKMGVLRIFWNLFKMRVVLWCLEILVNYSLLRKVVIECLWLSSLFNFLLF